MRDATLCFLMQGNPAHEILLGLKQVGFGEGKYGGFGGKIEADETPEMAAVRELEEEAGISVSEDALQNMGRLTFLFPAKPDWNQVVHVFVAKAWNGAPLESAEMKPAWFKVDEIPYERMWQDSSYWMPFTLAGKRISARFTFKEDNETVDESEIEEWHDNE